MRSSDGRPSRKRFLVRLGRCDGAVGVALRFMSMKLNADADADADADANGRSGELKVLDEARENSDSERLRLMVMIGKFS